MSAPSLHEIEKAASTLWLNKEARDWLSSGRRQPRPQCLLDTPDAVLNALDQNGVNLYAKLLSFGHHDVMASIYPYCSKLIGAGWDALVEDYLQKFPPDHYNFNRLCSKLPEYVTTYGGIYLKSYPFLQELADYEWLELEKYEDVTEISVYPNHPLTDLSHVGAISPVVNPTLTVRRYQYDIMEIANCLEANRKLPVIKEEPSFIAIYRDPNTHRARLVQIDYVDSEIIEASRQNKSYQQLIPVALNSMPGSSPEEAVLSFLELVEELQELHIFVGCRPST